MSFFSSSFEQQVIRNKFKSLNSSLKNEKKNFRFNDNLPKKIVSFKNSIIIPNNDDDVFIIDESNPHESANDTDNNYDHSRQQQQQQQLTSNEENRDKTEEESTQTPTQPFTYNCIGESIRVASTTNADGLINKLAASRTKRSISGRSAINLVCMLRRKSLEEEKIPVMQFSSSVSNYSFKEIKFQSQLSLPDEHLEPRMRRMSSHGRGRFFVNTGANKNLEKSKSTLTRYDTINYIDWFKFNKKL